MTLSCGILLLPFKLTIIENVVQETENLAVHSTHCFCLSSHLDICSNSSDPFHKSMVCQGLGDKEEISEISGQEEEKGQNMEKCLW